MAADGRRVASIGKHARQTVKVVFASPAAVEAACARGFWVAVDGDEIVGCVGLSSASEIRCLAVAPGARRRGIASALLAAAEARRLGSVRLETIGGMDAAVSLYERVGYELVSTRVVPAKSGDFELRSYCKSFLEEPRVLEAVPLVEADATEPAVSIAFVSPLATRVSFRLPSPLFARIGVVFRLGGRRYVARRRRGDGPRTIPAGALVSCELDAHAPPAWAFERRVNTFRAKPLDCNEEGPCTCNADCLVA